MQMDNRPLIARTHDLGLAASLLSCGFELRSTNRDRNGRLYFMFKQTSKLTRAIDSYWADTLNVRARTLNDNIKMLKGRIYAED